MDIQEGFGMGELGVSQRNDRQCCRACRIWHYALAGLRARYLGDDRGGLVEVLGAGQRGP